MNKQMQNTTPTQTADMIKEFVLHTRKYIHTYVVITIREDTQRQAGSGADPAIGQEIFDLRGEMYQARHDLLEVGHRLKEPLHHHGHDVKGLLRIMHAADGGGGAKVAARGWSNVKVELQAAAISLKSPVSTDASDAGSKPTGSANDRVMILLQKDPSRNWKAKQLADEVGCHVGTIRKCIAYKVWRSSQAGSGRLRAGYKSSDGRIEAEDDS